jgi:uncharacterized membrane protein
VPRRIGFPSFLATLPCIPAMVLAYLLPVLLALLLITPPWQNPDEPLHMARAVQIAHGGLLGYRAWTTSGGLSDPAIYNAYNPVRHAAMHPAEHLSRQDLELSNSTRFSPRISYLSFPNTAQYPPFFYLPDAAAYWIGRATGLSINHTLLLARTANAGLFALIAATALGVARRARPLLAVLILLPGTLQLACSASQDSLLLATTVLAVALLDRAMAEQRATSRTESVLLAIMLAAIAMARPPYAGFLALLLMLSPVQTVASLRLMGTAAACVLAWCILTALHSSVRFAPANLHAQLAFLAGHASQLPAILAATARFYALEYWVQLIGVLGWTDTRMPGAYTLFATAVLLLAACASTAGCTRRAWAAWAAIAFATITIFLLQYLTWTWPGQLVITGVLGRYFTPIAMAAALALPAWPSAAKLRPAACTGIIALAAITPAVTIHTLLMRFYVR